MDQHQLKKDTTTYAQTINKLSEVDEKGKPNLKYNALWLDPFSAPTEEDRVALKNASIKLLSVVTLDDLKKVLKQTNFVVIRLKENSLLYDEVFSLTHSVQKHLPIICRIDRTEFELGIEAMRKGAFQVLPSNSANSEDWKSLVKLVDQHNKRKKNSFVFVDKESQKLLKLAEKVAVADVTTLITGPTGSGKEVLAKILHDASKRYAEPFVSINCGAIPENLMEDLLFGHEKGAFTGAVKEHRGVFEQAHKGTLFLDEIGELPVQLQTKLLRVLQERVVTRLGGSTPVEVDFRLVAATNKDLKEAIRSREFREDLYFRISTFRLKISALSKRKEDILPLAAQIISKHSAQEINFSKEAEEKLLGYEWPGNVRELDNVIQRALVLKNSLTITAKDLVFDELVTENMLNADEDISYLENQRNHKQNSSHELQKEKDNLHQGKTSSANLNLDEVIRHSEFRTIVSAIKSSSNRNDAAKKLGISPRTLRYKIAQLKNLESPEFSFE